MRNASFLIGMLAVIALECNACSCDCGDDSGLNCTDDATSASDSADIPEGDDASVPGIMDGSGDSQEPISDSGVEEDDDSGQDGNVPEGGNRHVGVVSSYPREDAKCFPVNRCIIIKFNTEMDRDSVETNFRLYNPDGLPIHGDIEYEDQIATFCPGQPLEIGETYTAEVSGDTTDISGNLLSDTYSLEFLADAILYEDFEFGEGPWYVSNGIWEIGSVGADFGPGDCFNGTQCAGTVLNGKYTTQDNSSLIGKDVTLPEFGAEDKLYLEYRSWFDYGRGDSGSLRIRVREPSGEWSQWTTISSISGKSLGWSHQGGEASSDELSMISGKTVTLAFYHNANRECLGCGTCLGGWDCSDDMSTGWYIDDVIAHTCEID